MKKKKILSIFEQFNRPIFLRNFSQIKYQVGLQNTNILGHILTQPTHFTPNPHVLPHFLTYPLKIGSSLTISFIKYLPSDFHELSIQTISCICICSSLNVCNGSLLCFHVTTAIQSSSGHSNTVQFRTQQGMHGTTGKLIEKVSFLSVET